MSEESEAHLDLGHETLGQQVVGLEREEPVSLDDIHGPVEPALDRVDRGQSRKCHGHL